MLGVPKFLTRERELRMLWEVRRGEAHSYLVGTAHFFPYHFEGSLRRYLSDVDTVLLEGPLDEQAMRQVVESGLAEGGGRLLGDALDAQAAVKINRELGAPSPALSTHRLYRELFGVGVEDLVAVQIAGLKPWMAFFQIWTRYLRRHGWKYSMELDVLRIAAELGRPVHVLETIEEQIAALDGVPLDRIVNFLATVDWSAYRRGYVRDYLNGALAGMATRARDFPTYCQAIVGDRDPILYERMRPYVAAGKAIAFVGVIHIPGVVARLRADGYHVAPPAGR